MSVWTMDMCSHLLIPITMSNCQSRHAHFTICPFLPHLHFLIRLFLDMPIAFYVHCPRSQLLHKFFVGLALVNDQEKCFVIEIQLQNQAVFSLPNVIFVSHAVRTQYQVTKLRQKTCFKYHTWFPSLSSKHDNVFAQEQIFLPGGKYYYVRTQP